MKAFILKDSHTQLRVLLEDVSLHAVTKTTKRSVSTVTVGLKDCETERDVRSKLVSDPKFAKLMNDSVQFKTTKKIFNPLVQNNRSADSFNPFVYGRAQAIEEMRKALAFERELAVFYQAQFQISFQVRHYQTPEQCVFSKSQDPAINSRSCLSHHATIVWFTGEWGVDGDDRAGPTRRGCKHDARTSLYEDRRQGGLVMV